MLCEIPVLRGGRRSDAAPPPKVTIRQHSSVLPSPVATIETCYTASGPDTGWNTRNQCTELMNPCPKPEPREKKARRPIRQVSRKQAQRIRKYKDVKYKYLEEKPYCECGCGRRSSQIHHKKGRLGDLLIDTRFFMAVSNFCHRRIEDNPSLAYARGWSLSRTAS